MDNSQKSSAFTAEVVKSLSDRLMIATIGFYQHSRIEFAIAHRPVAKIVMIHSSAKKSRDAAKKIEGKYGSDMVECYERDPWNYETLLTTAMTIPERYPELVPEYHIGLGTRVMTMALAMAAMFTGNEIFMVMEDEEKTMRELKEIRLLPFRTMQIQKKIFLEVLVEVDTIGFKSKEDWRNAARRKLVEYQGNGKHLKIEISKSNRHMNHLIEWEFARIERVGNSHTVNITTLGKTVLTLKHVRRQLWSKPRRE